MRGGGRKRRPNVRLQDQESSIVVQLGVDGVRTYGCARGNVNKLSN